jgi:hypothetical protein
MYRVAAAACVSLPTALFLRRGVIVVVVVLVVVSGLFARVGSRYEVVAGAKYLVCSASHLTAFIASTGGAVSRFSVNAVHPLDDAGDLPVRQVHTCGFAA